MIVNLYHIGNNANILVIVYSAILTHNKEMAHAKSSKTHTLGGFCSWMGKSGKSAKKQ